MFKLILLYEFLPKEKDSTDQKENQFLILRVDTMIVDHVDQAGEASSDVATLSESSEVLAYLNRKRMNMRIL